MNDSELLANERTEGGGLIIALSFAMLFTWLYQTMTSAGD